MRNSNWLLLFSAFAIAISGGSWLLVVGVLVVGIAYAWVLERIAEVVKDIGWERAKVHIKKEVKETFIVLFGVGESAKQLRRQRRLWKLCDYQPRVIKLRGVEIKHEHIVPDCKRGKPPYTKDTRCVLGALGYDDKFRMYRVTYSVADDGWLFHDRYGIQDNLFDQRPLRPRNDNDYWIDELDFEVALQNAFIRATRERLAQPN